MHGALVTAACRLSRTFLLCMLSFTQWGKFMAMPHSAMHAHRAMPSSAASMQRTLSRISGPALAASLGIWRLEAPTSEWTATSTQTTWRVLSSTGSKAMTAHHSQSTLRVSGMAISRIWKRGVSKFSKTRDCVREAPQRGRCAFIALGMLGDKLISSSAAHPCTQCTGATKL